MQHFRTNPPSRQIKPAPAYVPTFYPLPSGSPVQSKAEARLSAAETRAINARLLAGLTRYLKNHPAIDEAMLGRLFAGDDDLLPDMRDGIMLPKHRRERIAAFLVREGCNA